MQNKMAAATGSGLHRDPVESGSDDEEDDCSELMGDPEVEGLMAAGDGAKLVSVITFIQSGAQNTRGALAPRIYVLRMSPKLILSFNHIKE